ncbi:MAG: hypothetical protein WDO71_26915 [Bacteroidota bacterium]
MKTLKVFSILPLFLAFAIISFAQKTKTETIPVSGNCGMCETKIEKAAKKQELQQQNGAQTQKCLL